MDTLKEILDPQFVLRNSVWVTVLVGLTCPWIGVFLLLRRLVFMGVALPQISSAGIALAFSLPMLGLANHEHGGHFEGDERLLALVGGLTTTLIALLVLALLERRRRGSVEGRVGTAYVLAGALSILLLTKNPTGERGLLDLLRGEVIAVSNLDLFVTAEAFLGVGILLSLCWKELLFVSYDRDMALTLKKNVVAWDCLLFLLIGMTISVAVLSVGPMVTFGFVLIPPLIGHQWGKNMKQFGWIASSVGAASAFLGFLLAYRLDLPVGPTDVALLGCLYGIGTVFRKLLP